MPTKPPVYKIAAYNGDVVEGTFYGEELQHVIKTAGEYYRVEKVIKSRMRRGKKEVLVKWEGYSDDFNSWVPAHNVKLNI